MLSKVTHNWSDEYYLTTLKHLRTAAGPETRLVIVGLAMPTVGEELAARKIPGVDSPCSFPQPLLRSHARKSTDILVRKKSGTQTMVMT